MLILKGGRKPKNFLRFRVKEIKPQKNYVAWPDTSGLDGTPVLGPGAQSLDHSVIKTAVMWVLPAPLGEAGRRAHAAGSPPTHGLKSFRFLFRHSGFLYAFRTCFFMCFLYLCVVGRERKSV